MKRAAARCLGLSVVIAACLAFAQDAAAPLTITSAASLPATVGKQIGLTMTAKGGTPPYSWQIISGKLPTGVVFDVPAGAMTGTPTRPGEFHFTVMVTDLGSQQTQRDFVLNVTAPSTPLTIDWKEPPRIHGDAIQGSAVVANQSDQPFDMTVIVLAVNEIGRATALGYQRFSLQPQSSQVVAFGATPGGGRYVVHADAIAEVESTGSIFRARKQTSTSLKIKVD